MPVGAAERFNSRIRGERLSDFSQEEQERERQDKVRREEQEQREKVQKQRTQQEKTRERKGKRLYDAQKNWDQIHRLLKDD